MRMPPRTGRTASPRWSSEPASSLRFVDRHVEEVRARGERLAAELAQTRRDALALLEERADLGRGLQRGNRERGGECRQRRGMLALVQLRRDVAACEGVPHPCAGEPEHLRERAQHDDAFLDQADGRVARVFEVRLVDDERPRVGKLAELARWIVRPAADRQRRVAIVDLGACDPNRDRGTSDRSGRSRSRPGLPDLRMHG